MGIFFFNRCYTHPTCGQGLSLALCVCGTTHQGLSETCWLHSALCLAAPPDTDPPSAQTVLSTQRHKRWNKSSLMNHVCILDSYNHLAAKHASDHFCPLEISVTAAPRPPVKQGREFKGRKKSMENYFGRIYLWLESSSAPGPEWTRRTSVTPWRRQGSGGCFSTPQTCGRPLFEKHALRARSEWWTGSSGRWTPGRSGWRLPTPGCSRSYILWAQSNTDVESRVGLISIL